MALQAVIEVQLENFTILNAKFSTFRLTEGINDDQLKMVSGLWVILQSLNGPWSASRENGTPTNHNLKRKLEALDPYYFFGRIVPSISWIDATRAPLKLRKPDVWPLSKSSIVFSRSYLRSVVTYPSM